MLKRQMDTLVITGVLRMTMKDQRMVDLEETVYKEIDPEVAVVARLLKKWMEIDSIRNVAVSRGDVAMVIQLPTKVHAIDLVGRTITNRGVDGIDDVMVELFDKKSFQILLIWSNCFATLLINTCTVLVALR